MYIKEEDVWSVSSRDCAPEQVKGGFNRSVSVYTVSKKGKLTLIGTSDQCTLEGDVASIPVNVPNAPRIAIKCCVSGNGGFTSLRLYGVFKTIFVV